MSSIESKQYAELLCSKLRFAMTEMMMILEHMDYDQPQPILMDRMDHCIQQIKNLRNVFEWLRHISPEEMDAFVRVSSQYHDVLLRVIAQLQ